MELYKITFGYTKKFYESKRTFEKNWTWHTRFRARFQDVVAYQIDCEKEEWKEIRRARRIQHY